jgi:hypothetical protein
MRAYILLSGLVLLAGCATQQETEQLNTALYNRCVASSRQAGVDPAQKCGTNPATYKSTFSEKYYYFRDQQNAQRQAQAAETPQQAYARSCYSAALMAPTRTGSFGEAQANANLAYQQCLNGMPMNVPKPRPTYATPPPAAPVTTVCRPNGGNVECTTQ